MVPRQGPDLDLDPGSLLPQSPLLKHGANDDCHAGLLLRLKVIYVKFLVRHPKECWLI